MTLSASRQPSSLKLVVSSVTFRYTSGSRSPPDGDPRRAPTGYGLI
jgi:hypothetical protein